MSANLQFDSIAATLGLPPLKNEVVEVVDVVDTTPIDDPDAVAKQNIADAISTGQTALQDMLSIAQASQNARAFEVVATLINSITDASVKLSAIDVKRQEVRAKTKGGPQSQVTNNNLYVGNAAELLSMIKGEKNKNGL